MPIGYGSPAGTAWTAATYAVDVYGNAPRLAKTAIRRRPTVHARLPSSTLGRGWRGRIRAAVLALVWAANQADPIQP